MQTHQAPANKMQFSVTAKTKSYCFFKKILINIIQEHTPVHKNFIFNEMFSNIFAIKEPLKFKISFLIEADFLSATCSLKVHALLCLLHDGKAKKFSR